MFLPVMIYFIVFKYFPMAGLIIAFKKYTFIKGIWGSPWAGLSMFKLIFSTDQMLDIIWNTLLLSGLSIIVGFPAPILLALLLNEVRKLPFKRMIQTFVYLPHFLNWVIVSGVVLSLFSVKTGVVNHWLLSIFGFTYPFLYKEFSWLTIFLSSGIWKEAGWGCIIYLAALASIDHSLYEAASIDGANKWKQMIHITLPGIVPTAIILLILQIGKLMELGFDQVYVLQNSTVGEISEVMSTYIYKIGIQQGQFSLASAMGLFESFVGLVLVITANWIARRFGQGLW
nr:ABC transporter permease subunit [Paenibacillus allorhizoplanae]